MPFLDSLKQDAGIFDIFETRPEIYEPFVEMVERASRGPSPLSPGQRELIGAYVSSLNACQMCAGIHDAAAKASGADATDEEKLRPLLAFVEKLTLTPERLSVADARAVMDAGFTERALHDAVLIACIASFMNRFVFGLGLDARSKAQEAAGRAIERAGYWSRFRDRLSGTATTDPDD